jgi:hypothetical protein
MKTAAQTDAELAALQADPRFKELVSS